MYDINFFKDVKVFGPLKQDSAKKSSLREIDYIFQDVKHIEGNTLEFGVYTGSSLRKIAFYRENSAFGFDSFVGLPEAWVINQEINDIYEKGHFNLGGRPPSIENVYFYKGYFNATIPKYIEKHKKDIDFLHIDVDLYSSARDILFGLNNFIRPGTIIRFDELTDWRIICKDFSTTKFNRLYKNWEDGEWKAFLEWSNTFKRKVEPISRNFAFSSTMRVIE